MALLQIYGNLYPANPWVYTESELSMAWQQSLQYGTSISNTLRSSLATSDKAVVCPSLLRTQHWQSFQLPSGTGTPLSPKSLTHPSAGIEEGSVRDNTKEMSPLLEWSASQRRSLSSFFCITMRLHRGATGSCQYWWGYPWLATASTSVLWPLLAPGDPLVLMTDWALCVAVLCPGEDKRGQQWQETQSWWRLRDSPTGSWVKLDSWVISAAVDTWTSFPVLLLSLPCQLMLPLFVDKDLTNSQQVEEK